MVPSPPPHLGVWFGFGGFGPKSVPGVGVLLHVTHLLYRSCAFPLRPTQSCTVSCRSWTDRQGHPIVWNRANSSWYTREQNPDRSSDTHACSTSFLRTRSANKYSPHTVCRGNSFQRRLLANPEQIEKDRLLQLKGHIFLNRTEPWVSYGSGQSLSLTETLFL